jgi:hypothetical protein
MSTPVYTPFFNDWAGAPARDDFPQADAVVIADRTRVTLHPDGRTCTAVKRAVKVFSEFGRDRTSDTQVVFRDGRQKLSILGAATFMADGTRMDSPELTRVIMTPFALDRAPAWSDYQQLNLTNVGSETNAVNVVEYEVEDPKPWKPFFFGAAVFGEMWPVIDKVFEVAVPKGATLAYALRGAASKPTVTHADGLTVYAWHASELPGFPLEDQAPTAGYVLPGVVFSTVPSFAHMGKTLHACFEEHSAPDDAIKAWAQKTTKDLFDETEKILAIHREIVAGTRHISWPITANGVTGRSAAEVFSSRYGNPLEAGFLLAAALRAAGIEANFVLGCDRPLFHEDVPYLSNRTEVWVCAGSEDLLLNATKPAQNTGPYAAAERAFLLISEDGAVPFTPRAFDNTAEIEAELALDDDLAAKGKVSFRNAGRFNPFLDLQASEDDEAAKGKVQPLPGHVFPGATLTTFDIRRMDLDRADIRTQCKAPAPKKAAPELTLLEIPPAAIGLLGLSSPLHRSERTTVHDLKGPFRVHMKLTLTLPADVTVQAAPENLDGTAGPFRYQRTWKVEEKEVTLEEVMEAQDKYLPPEAWEDFRRLTMAFENPVRNRLVLVHE